MKIKTDKKLAVILKEDISGLGYKYDTVRVKPGYGRNYLLPKNIAMLANTSNTKMVEELKKQAAHKVEKIKSNAVELASSIGDMILEIKAKAGETGRIFGAVTTLQIADALSQKGFEVDRKRISLPDVKSLGEYEAQLDLHREVQHTLKFVVIED